MKIGIAIDDWKQPTFERILTENNFTYEAGEGVTADTRMLYVEIPNSRFDELKATIQKCQNKSAELKG